MPQRVCQVQVLQQLVCQVQVLRQTVCQVQVLRQRVCQCQVPLCLITLRSLHLLHQHLITFPPFMLMHLDHLSKLCSPMQHLQQQFCQFQLLQFLRLRLRLQRTIHVQRILDGALLGRNVLRCLDT